MYKNIVNLYNLLLAIYVNDCNSITNEEKEDMDKKYDASNLFVKGYKYDKWYKKLDIEKHKSQPEENIAERVTLIPSEGTIEKDSDDTTKSVISPMPTLKGCEEELKE